MPGLAQEINRKSDRGAQLMSLRWLQIPVVTVDSEVISGGVSKAVLRAIDGYGDICWASAVTLSTETCFSGRSVRRAIKALESLGFIAVESRNGQTNNIRILWQNIIGTPSTLDAVSDTDITSTPSTTDGTPSTTDGTPSTTDGTPSTLDDNTKETKETKEIRNRALAFVRPSLDEVKSFWKLKKLNGNPEGFYFHYEANGWVQGKSKPIRDWHKAAYGWSARQAEFSTSSNGKSKRTVNVGPGAIFDPARNMENATF